MTQWLLDTIKDSLEQAKCEANTASSQTIGQQILEQFKETGYLGCFSDACNLSSNYKECLDFRDKV